MKNRSQFLSGFLAGRGYYYQASLRERAEQKGNFIEICFFAFDDHEHKKQIGGLKFLVPKGTKAGDDGTMLVIAETVVRKLNTTRIPHRPSVIPVVWGARIIQIVREILGIGSKADADPISRLKEIANVCAFFTSEGGDGPVDASVPPYIAGPMAEWLKLQTDGESAEDSTVPSPGNAAAEAEFVELFSAVVPFLAKVQMIGETMQLFWPGHTCTWPVSNLAPVFASQEVEDAWHQNISDYCDAHPDFYQAYDWAVSRAFEYKIPKAGAVTILGQIRDALEAGLDKVVFMSGPTELDEVTIPPEVLEAARTAIAHRAPAVVSPADQALIERVSQLPAVIAANEAMQAARDALNEAEREGKGERVLQSLHEAYMAAIEAVGTARQQGEAELKAVELPEPALVAEVEPVEAI
jgi:hypothetical protein